MQRSLRHGVSLVVLLALVALAGSAFGQQRAFQERVFGGGHELSLSGGYLPLDPYSKAVSGGLSYAWHLGEAVSWRALDLRLTNSWSTDLKEDLLGSGRATVDQFERPALLATSDLIMEPFHGKQSFLNRGDVRVAVYVLAGGGVVQLESSDEAAWRPALDLGFGFRVYVLPWLSLIHI